MCSILSMYTFHVFFPLLPIHLARHVIGRSRLRKLEGVSELLAWTWWENIRNKNNRKNRKTATNSSQLCTFKCINLYIIIYAYNYTLYIYIYTYILIYIYIMQQLYWIIIIYVHAETTSPRYEKQGNASTNLAPRCRNAVYVNMLYFGRGLLNNEDEQL